MHSNVPIVYSIYYYNTVSKADESSVRVVLFLTGFIFYFYTDSRWISKIIKQNQYWLLGLGLFVFIFIRAREKNAVTKVHHTEFRYNAKNKFGTRSTAIE